MDLGSIHAYSIIDSAKLLKDIKKIVPSLFQTRLFIRHQYL